MDVLDQAKLVVAEKALRVGAHERRKLELRAQIVERRLRIATLSSTPEFVIVACVAYLVLSLAIQLYQEVRKGRASKCNAN